MRDRLYRLVKLTGWTVEEIDNTSAVELDWLLAVDHTHRQVEAERQGDG